jgi:hypothetical protein
MINEIRSWSVRPRLTMNTMMLLIAVSAPCFALYALSYHFAPVNRSAARTAALAVVAAWSLAAALPALWVGAVRRTPPKGLLVRFAAGNTFLAALIGGGNPFLIVTTLGSAVLVPSLGWYALSLTSPGTERDRIKSAVVTFSSYVIQLALTFLLFIATIPLLDRLL